MPQGSILGPLFFLIFINDLPLNIASSRIEVDLYADDTTLCYSADVDAMDDMRNTLSSAWKDIESWTNSNKLPLNNKKTKSLLVTGKRLNQKIPVEDRQLSLRTSKQDVIEQVDSARLLGLELDSELTFSCHIEKLSKKLSSRIAVLNKIKSCLPLKQRILYYNAMIRPVINYVSVVWHTSSNINLLKILRLQKRAARLILDAEPRSSSVPLFNRLQWLPFYNEAKIAKCSIIFKRTQHSVPEYLLESLKCNSDAHSRKTRYCKLNFICPKFNRKTEGGKSFHVSAVQLWNSLPNNV